MKTYYLIDFENVGVAGLSGCEKLKKTDHILIFFTKNASKINMSGIANHGGAELDMIEIPPGKQSVDIHIGSYLGYLCGSDCQIVIVSKDTDFDHVIKFWKTKTGVKASRTSMIQQSLAQAAQKQKQESAKKTNPLRTDQKGKLNEELQKAFNATKLDHKIVGELTSAVVSHYGEARFSKAVQKELQQRFPNDQTIYSAIKAVVEKYDPASNAELDKSTAGLDKSKRNCEIQQLLSEAKLQAEVIGFVASLVVKNIDVKHGKQQIYRGIISKYGQEAGLKIYNLIKKHI